MTATWVINYSLSPYVDLQTLIKKCYLYVFIKSKILEHLEVSNNTP